MKGDSLPALYQAADSASDKSQRNYFRCIKTYAVLSIAGAGLSSVGVDSQASAVLAAAVFIAGLFLTIFMIAKKFDSAWYRARAVAESIKTSAWRFVMLAEPFEAGAPVQEEKAKFRTLLHKILKEHKDLAHDLAGTLSEKNQITEKMLSIRGKSLADRMAFYREHRIDEQRSWYAGKSENNKRNGKIWFWALVGLQGGAILFSLLRIAFPEWKLWPTAIFIVGATSALGWMQGKRFRELAAAYGLAAHEIGLARDELEDIKDEAGFSKFVGDAENAFSREHTQWIARKD